MVLQGTDVVENFYRETRYDSMCTTVHLVPTTALATVTNFSLLNISQCRMDKQLWTRPELKVTEKWNLYYILSISS